MKNDTIIQKPQSLCWDTVPRLSIDCPLWSQPAGIQAFAQLCYDDTALYVKLTAVEAQIRAEHKDPLDFPCEDSCLEFFFCPMPGDTRYFNIEFNPNCCLYLGLAHNRYDLVRLLPPRSAFSPRAERTQDGWSIAYQIPFSFIRLFFPDFQAVPGGSIRANCFKCGDLTPNPHFLSWNPIDHPTPDFHRPQDFGILYFK